MFGRRTEIRVLGHFGEAASVLAQGTDRVLRPLDVNPLAQGRSIDVPLGGTKFVLIETSRNPTL